MGRKIFAFNTSLLLIHGIKGVCYEDEKRKTMFCSCGNVSKNETCDCGNNEWITISYRYMQGNMQVNRCIIKELSDFSIKKENDNYQVFKKVLTFDTTDKKYSFDENEEILFTIFSDKIIFHSYSITIEDVERTYNNCSEILDERVSKILKEAIETYNFMVENQNMTKLIRFLSDIYHSIAINKTKNVLTKENYKKYPFFLVAFSNDNLFNKEVDGIDEFLVANNFPLQFKDVLSLCKSARWFRSTDLFNFLTDNEVEQIATLEESTIKMFKYFLISSNCDLTSIREVLNWINENPDENRQEIITRYLRNNVPLHTFGTVSMFFKKEKKANFSRYQDIFFNSYEPENILEFLKEKDFDEMRRNVFIDIVEEDFFKALKLLTKKTHMTERESNDLY